MPHCPPRHRSTRARARPRATSPTPHRRDPRAARSHRPSAPDLTFGSAASSPREGAPRQPARALGWQPPWQCPHRPLLPAPLRPPPAKPRRCRDAHGSGYPVLPGKGGLPPTASKPPPATGGGLIFEALTPPSVAAPAAIPSAPSPHPRVPAEPRCAVAYLKWLCTEGPERREGAGVRYFSIPGSGEPVTKALLNCSLSGL